MVFLVRDDALGVRACLALSALVTIYSSGVDSARIHCFTSWIDFLSFVLKLLTKV